MYFSPCSTETLTALPESGPDKDNFTRLVHVIKKPLYFTYLRIQKQNLGTKAGKLSETEIVSLLQSRDVRGVEALYDQFGNFFYAHIYKIVGFEDVAEIVLQDTFLKAWNKIESYSDQKGRFVTWMINIAKNSAIDMMRSKNYQQTIKLISLENAWPESEKNILNVRMENLDVRDIVAKMDPKYCVLIELVYFKGYTHREVADHLQLPLGTVKSRIRKAFSELKTIFAN